MKYSKSIDFTLPNMYDMYWGEFGHKLDDPKLYFADKRILPVVTGFLITGKDIKWPVENLMSSLGLELKTARVFVTNPNKKLQIHRDCIGGTSQLRSWAINIPIANCELGTNEWFTDEDNDFGHETYAPGGSAIMPEHFENDYIVDESCVLNSIKLIRTDVMHRSNNLGNDNRRVVLSLRGSDDLTYEEVAERVNDFNRRVAENHS